MERSAAANENHRIFTPARLAAERNRWGVSPFCLLAVACRKSAAPQVKRGLAAGVICA
jgi:hypothetical protein